MLDWLRRLVDRAPRPWPEGIPQLYPDQPDADICQVASRPLAASQRHARVVMVCPLHASSARPSTVAVGVGASRVILDGLSRVPGLSVRGPEDTPLGALPVARRRMRVHPPADVIVSGRVLLEPAPRADLVLLWRDRAEQAIPLRATTPERLLLLILEALAVSLGGRVSPPVRSAWAAAMPPSVKALRTTGALLVMPSAGNPQLAALWRKHPAFSVPLHGLRRRSGDADDDCDLLVEACAACPDDPRLHLMAFERLWDGRPGQPAALQYLRRALELAPGLGRAWLYAAHAAHPQADRLAFAEVGYRLLPGDPCATSGYARALRRQRGSADRCVSIAREGIAADPYGPGNYELAIEGLVEMGRCAEALDLAERLQRLYEPEIHERTRRRLWQDPLLRTRLCDQGWDPAAEVRQRIARIRRRL